MNLSEVVDEAIVEEIQTAKKISFHAVGDTGAGNVGKNESPATALKNQDSVADLMAADLEGAPGDAPSFLYLLGDLIYSFGEAQYYHDQFYEPYRAYDRPIFAVPGNHDGMVYGPSPKQSAAPSLQAFLRNFCADAPGPSPDSGGLVRSVMTQPGVYFTLEAPFVSIIGLYSNVLDGPGVISSQGGHYKNVVDDQLDYLTKELKRLKPQRESGERAVILALHHPPASIDSKHGGSTGIAKDIDSCCTNADFWPDAVLAGHAHLYQRISRKVKGLSRTIPYITAGCGGYAAKAGKSAKKGLSDGTYTLVTPPIGEFGYLTVSVDFSAKIGTLTIAYRSTKKSKDSVTLSLSKD
jgi:hypothetical protein